MQDMGVISEHREYEYSVNPSFLTKFLKAMLFISIGMTVLLLISNFMQFELVSSGTITKSSADANDTPDHANNRSFMIAFLSWDKAGQATSIRELFTYKADSLIGDTYLFDWSTQVINEAYIYLKHHPRK